VNSGYYLSTYRPPRIPSPVKIEHVAKAQISNSRFGFLVTMQPLRSAAAALFAVSDAPGRSSQLS
jgi:hypothetical protein